MPEKVIPITKVQIGHVVGKGGSTIRSIQEESGAKVEIVDDGPAVRITADDDAKVAAAEAAVMKVIESQENPDYEGPEGARLRQEANALGDKRSKLFDEATSRRSAGDHDGANRLAEEAKRAGEEMHARNKEAAVAIAKFNNEDKGKGDDYFDMHGLREEEAMELLKERLAVLEAKPRGTVTDFEVIPGAGHHSAPGGQKLKGATEALLKEKGYAYESVSAGSIVGKIPGNGSLGSHQQTCAAESTASGGVPMKPAPPQEAAGDECVEGSSVAQSSAEEVSDDETEEANGPNAMAAGNKSEPAVVFHAMPPEVRERISKKGFLQRSKDPDGSGMTAPIVKRPVHVAN